MKKLLLAGVAAAAIGGFAFSPAAHATVMLQLTSGATTVGPFTGTALGTGSSYTYNGTVGAWTINITTGLSNGPDHPSMDLSSINATTSGSADPLTISLTDTGFLIPGNSTLVATGHIVPGTGSGTASYSAYFDTSDTPFAETTLIASVGPFSGSYNVTSGGPGPATTPYSLTQVVTLTAGTGGVQWSTDSSVAVPEPGSLALLGTALVALGFIGWMVKRRDAA